MKIPITFILSLAILALPLEARRRWVPLIAGAAVAGWTDSMTVGEINGTQDGTAADFAFVQDVIALPAGTVSKLRIYITQDLNGSGAKLGLYNGTTRVASAVAPSTPTGSNYWLEINTGTTPVITAGNYKISANLNGNATDYVFGVKTGQPSGTSWISLTTTYAAMVTDPAPANNLDRTLSNAVGAYITP